MTRLLSHPRLLAVALCLVTTAAVAAPNWHPGHYILTPIGQGAAGFQDTAMLAADPKFTGVQKRYWWRDLEIALNTYDFNPIFNDVLWVRDNVGTNRYFVIQIQIKDFSNGHAVPTYMWNTTGTTYRSPQKMGVGPGRPVEEWAYGEFNEGNNNGSGATTRQAMYWLPAVNARLQALYTALKNAINAHARAADLKATIESIVINETACEEGIANDHLDRGRAGYSQAACVSALKSNLTHLRSQFPDFTILQYINFLPPANSTGGADIPGQIAKLTEVAAHAATLTGIGIGCPDVRVAINPPGFTVIRDYQASIPVSSSVQGADYKVPETRDGVWKRGLNDTGASPWGLLSNYMVWLDQDNHDTSVWGYWIGTTITDPNSVRLKVSNSTFPAANAAKPLNVP